MTGRSQSVSTVYGVLDGVCGGPQAAVPSFTVSEISKMRELLRRQQVQLNQMMVSITQLQSSSQHRVQHDLDP